ncbi:hypothetical protein MYX76_04090 [Desulfobacterota bacterium AH_259_B03_O07]|nr:hypothetical protein [Desulfobacterota bacterium AH_259_B03_O07]
MAKGVLVGVVASGLIALAIILQWYLLIIAAFLLSGAGLVFLGQLSHRKLSPKDFRHWYTSQFLKISIANIIALNLIVLHKGHYLQQILGTIFLGLAIYPMWRYLKRGERHLPLIPFFSMIYALHYGLPLFLPFDPYPTYRGIPDEVMMKSAVLAIIGLAVFLLAFYKCPSGFWRSLIPQLPDDWSEIKARMIAILFVVVGLSTSIFNSIFPSSIPIQFLSLLVYVENLGLLGTSILFLLYLRSHLPGMYIWFLWVGTIPSYIILSWGMGGGWLAAHLVVLLLLVYVADKRRIPWIPVIAASFAIFLLMANKTEIRTAFTGKENPLVRFSDNVRIFAKFLTSSDPMEIVEGLESVANRIDYLHRFAYVIERTPEVIPYWRGETYRNLLWKFIPRLIYPNKPTENVHLTYARRYELVRPNTATVPMPLLIELYANFGPLSVVIGMFLLGLVFQILYHVANYPGAQKWGLICTAFIGTTILGDMGANFSLVFGGLFLKIIALGLVGYFILGRSLHLPSRIRWTTTPPHG